MGNAIYRRRGDTYPVAVTITNEAGVPQDITGKVFLLTVSEEEDPSDRTSELFQLVGEITDAAAGEVEFPMTAEQADNVGNFFFDVEMRVAADGSDRRTVLKGPIVMGQDITKSIWVPPNPTQIWVPTGEVDDLVSMNGSEFWFLLANANAGDLYFKVAEREGTKVMRWSGGAYTTDAFLFAAGPDCERPTFYGGIFELSLVFYFEKNAGGDIYIEMNVGCQENPAEYSRLIFYPGRVATSTQWVYRADTEGAYTKHDFPVDYEAEWMNLVFYLDYNTYTFKSKCHALSEADPGWQTSWQRSKDAIPIPSPFRLLLYKGSSDAVLDVASYRWEQVG